MQCLPKVYFRELEQIFQKCIWNHKRPWIAIAILRKNKIGGLMPLDIKLHYKAIVVKAAWYRHKTDTWIKDQWRRIETRNKPKSLWSINILLPARNIQWIKNTLFNKWWWESWTGTYKKRNETWPPNDNIYKKKKKTSQDG